MRVYYDPIISNLNVHIRCMFSLWEGLVDALLSKHMGSAAQLRRRRKRRSRRIGVGMVR